MKIFSAALAITAVEAKGFPRDGLPQIALAGRSNAGKSSLINALVGSKSLARSSRTPGKTRLLNFYLVNDAFYLVDLPGWGYARLGGEERRNIEGILRGYFDAAPELKGVLYLVDPRVPDSPVDKAALEWLTEKQAPLLVLASKADKLGKVDLANALKRIQTLHHFPTLPLAVSSAKKIGLDDLWEQLQLLVPSGRPVIHL